MHDDFFVIWRDADGGAQRGWLKVFVMLAVLLALGLAVGLVSLQQTIAEDARFEFGTTRNYEGVLVGGPVPLLVTDSDVYFLVNPLKYEFDADARQQFTGRSVRLTATLIERGDQSMLEVVEDSVVDLGASTGSALDTGERMEDVVLSGEIVDSKCYLGVMNPGHLKPHRACAVNCLRGGIPPVLLTRDSNGAARQIVLVSADDSALQDWILPYVAEPVAVRGALQSVGPIEVMFVDAGAVTRMP